MTTSTVIWDERVLAYQELYACITSLEKELKRFKGKITDNGVTGDYIDSDVLEFAARVDSVCQSMSVLKRLQVFEDDLNRAGVVGDWSNDWPSEEDSDSSDEFV
jgi:hypothetical protein|tara:strand:- start:2475 stop:2786 length:312 start_codon:yes stop_codon:yes gene_type:complete